MYANPYSSEEIANRILQMDSITIYETYKNLGLDKYNTIFEMQVKAKNDLCNYIKAIID